MKRFVWNIRAWLYDRLIGMALRIEPDGYCPPSELERLLRREQQRFEQGDRR
jgi:hypothetical protein